MIDFRSDTITKPTPGMLKAMMNAEVGDDVFGEDPTINRLQDLVAELTGKEAALFVPSGTMGNQVSIKAHTQPGQEIIVERNSHIYNYECGSPAMLSGVQVNPIHGHHGAFTLEQVEESVRPVNIHHPVTTLICMENTHNRASGAIFPQGEMSRISSWAHSKGILTHLDGARLWNASIATGISLPEYCRLFDSASLCFSKGLGAPVGSIIVGNAGFIQKARFYRKAVGGGMRQAGILAAAAIYAVENQFHRLAEDHQNARELAEFLAGLKGFSIELENIKTNIVIFDVSATGKTASEISGLLLSNGVHMLPISKNRIRAVTHLHITKKDIERTRGIFEKLFV